MRVTEAMWAYFKYQGYGIWGLEFDWEDVGSQFYEGDMLKRKQWALSDAQKKADSFIDHLVGNHSAIAQLELVQRYYYDRVSAYYDALQAIREWFVDAWNGYDAHPDLDTLPHPLTLEVFDEWWANQDGDLSTMYEVLDVWTVTNR